MQSIQSSFETSKATPMLLPGFSGTASAPAASNTPEPVTHPRFSEWIVQDLLPIRAENLASRSFSPGACADAGASDVRTDRTSQVYPQPRKATDPLLTPATPQAQPAATSIPVAISKTPASSMVAEKGAPVDPMKCAEVALVKPSAECEAADHAIEKRPAPSARGDRISSTQKAASEPRKKLSAADDSAKSPTSAPLGPSPQAENISTSLADQFVPPAPVFTSPLEGVATTGQPPASATVTQPSTTTTAELSRALNESGRGSGLPVQQATKAESAPVQHAGGAAIPQQKAARESDAANPPRGSSSPRSEIVLRSGSDLWPNQMLHQATGTVTQSLTSSSHSSDSVGLKNVSPHAAQHSTGSAFERMDASSAPQMVQSTPRRLIVGVHEPGLGWVEVRARAAGGQITAAIATGPGSAHAVVSAELPAIRDYLTSQHVQVDRLMSEAFSASSGGSQGSSAGHANTARQQSTAASEPQPLSPQAMVAEPETDPMSCISIRV